MPCVVYSEDDFTGDVMNFAYEFKCLPNSADAAVLVNVKTTVSLIPPQKKRIHQPLYLA